MSTTTRTMGTRFGIGTGIILAVLVIPLGTAAAGTGQPGWQQGLKVRSEGLNLKYGVGGKSIGTLSVTIPGWQQGLKARSDALNRAYGLGTYATP